LDWLHLFLSLRGVSAEISPNHCHDEGHGGDACDDFESPVGSRT
jgi:hypothetical protein